MITFKSTQMENNNELKISKEKILEAAKKCKEAKETLQILFPSVFEEDLFVEIQSGSIGNPIRIYAEAGELLATPHFYPKDSKLEGRAIWLSPHFDWEIRQETYCSILIPKKKKQ